jgi:hypothetical protein
LGIASSRIEFPARLAHCVKRRFAAGQVLLLELRIASRATFWA